jgi:hypothetical protein
MQRWPVISLDEAPASDAGKARRIARVQRGGRPWRQVEQDQAGYACVKKWRRASCRAIHARFENTPAYS